MGQGADHAMRASARQLRIGIEGDDKPDALKNLQFANFYREAIVLASEQPVQIKQLAAFSFPTHPRLLSRVVHAVTMEHEKLSCPPAGIFAIEVTYELGTEFHQGVVFSRHFRGV